MWNNGARLWITREELRVSNANGYGRDRVVRRDGGVEVRLRRRVIVTSVQFRRGGGRWRRLGAYLRTAETTAPVALARAGWIASDQELEPYPDAFFQCCRIRRFTRRGWLVVDPDTLSIQRRRGTVVVQRASVAAVRLVRHRTTTSVELIGPDQRSVCSTFSPTDLRSALLARGWSVE
jgi:hypothetical protein